MDDTLILETSFLIDLEREMRRGEVGPAIEVLVQHPDHRLFVTPTIAGEMAAGASMSVRERWDRFLSPFQSLPLTPDVSWRYGQAFRYLQANGLTVGANDLWIAAVGLAYEVPVVSRNARDFRRVPGLEVIDYA